ncbi:MAG: SLC13 family permease [bacterium]|nr:SLC13 family permease [bacterium]MDE0287622.1 SLC13 family permease [bacterium]MDE0440090.1 SLC13 family permease [bacterium]
MTWQIAFLILLLVAMAYLFLTAKLPVDLTAFLGLAVLILGGYVGPTEAFSGFASPAVITMLAIFIISAALLYTGVADIIASKVYTLVGSKEIPLIITLMLVSGVLSAFMNNIAATAVLMPAVAAIARRAGLSASRLMMPLAFGSILGGTTTMVGTPPNIVAATILAEQDLEPFGLFEFTPIGALLLAAGVLFMITLGRKLLPDRQAGPGETETSDLTQVYHLEERLFTIRIPKESALDLVTLAEANLSGALGIQVVSILRQGARNFVPTAETVLKGGDVLLVEGRLSDLEDIMRVGDVELQPTTTRQIPRPMRGFTAIKAEVPAASGLVGKSPRDAQFRERYQVVIVGIERGEQTLREGLSSRMLEAGDRIIALGARSELQKMQSDPDFRVTSLGLTALRSLEGHISVIRVPPGSSLVGSTIGASRLGELVGVTIGGIVRGDVTRLATSPDEVIEAGDGLLVACDQARVEDLVRIGDIQVDTRIDQAVLESEDFGIVEVALAPRSAVVGKRLRDLEFRKRYGLQLLAVWRDGRSIYTGLPDLVFRLGDALLVQGPWERIRLLGTNPDFVVLSAEGLRPRRHRKAPLALGALLLMVGLVVFGIQPIHVAAFISASLVLLFRTVTMEEAYRAIEWRTIFLVAAVLPVGIAMGRTGAALLLVREVRDLVGPEGHYAILVALILLASLLSQCLDGAPAVVLLAPVALETAAQLGMNPYAAMMGISLAASAAFMTPFSHKANLLVMGAGGYRSIDYARVGTPLTVVVLAIVVVLVPAFFPI